MKKVLFVLVLFMAALVVNAQTQDTTKQVKPTITVVKLADLPVAITDNVAKDYAGFNIKDATLTNTDNVLTYNVVLVNKIATETATETLVYDKDGKFVKKLPPPPKIN